MRRPKPPCRVLVAAASKHGSTAEIGERLTEALRKHDLDTTFVRLDKPVAAAGYDAYVIGSAVYAGHWLSEARDFVAEHGQSLAASPVWLFSSGPVGAKPLPLEDAVDIEKMKVLTTSREHRIFGGRLDHTKLGMLERAAVLALRAPEGDFRPWEDIDAWAADIAASLEVSNQPRSP